MYPPRYDDEEVLRRWMALEVRRLAGGIVRERKTLAALLSEREPSALTKAGDRYLFRKDVLEKIAAGIPRSIHARLRLPILFHATPEVSGSWYLTDEPAVRALQELGDLSSLRTMEGGKLWISQPIAAAIMGKYPTVCQLAIGY